MIRLSAAEIETLIAAVEAWEYEPSTSGLMDSIVKALFAPGGPGVAEELKLEADARLAEAMAQARCRRRLGVRLVAKLLDLRDEAETAEAASSPGRPDADTVGVPEPGRSPHAPT